tara:strand:- start:1011 stop:1901 length:891 start_codon:yes stop_codon:yes gene_type:complete
MSYKHVLVATVEAVEAGSVAPTNINDYIAHHKREGESVFATFLEALAKKLPTCKFSPVGNSTEQLYVYLPTDHFVLGRVGWGDWSVDGKPTNSIMVQSPRIRNDKYAAERTQHYMWTSVNPKRALSNALGALRPHTPIAVAKHYAPDVASKVWNSDYEGRDKVSKIKGKVVRHDSLEQELRGIVASGYTFINAEFSDLVTSFLHEADEYSLRQQKIDMVYVRAYMLGDQQVFDTVPIANMHKNYNFDVEESFLRYTEDTLPDDIRGKLSMLLMVDMKEYVDGVGMRVHDEVFYVTQ